VKNEYIKSCLVTICSGRLVLRNSNVSWVRGLPLDSTVCVVGDSMIEVHNSVFSDNDATALAIFDNARVLVNASTISRNSLVGGVVVGDDANVTITGSSTVHGNVASENGGGLCARGRAVLMVAGNSSVSGNSANQFGGGVAAFDNVSITITGGSSVQGNTVHDTGGGLAVWGNGVSCTLMGGSRVYGNTAAMYGGGLVVLNNAAVILTGGSSVHENLAGVSGGGIMAFHSTVAITGGSSVRGNTARVSGGGLGMYGSRVTISNHSTVSNNTCVRGVGGGIAVEIVAPRESAGGMSEMSIQFDTRGRTVGSTVDPFVASWDHFDSVVTIKLGTRDSQPPRGGPGYVSDVIGNSQCVPHCTVTPQLV
jgi:hypothetical protein